MQISDEKLHQKELKIGRNESNFSSHQNIYDARGSDTRKSCNRVSVSLSAFATDNLIFTHENIAALTSHDAFLDRFFRPHPTHLRMTVSVEGSGFMTNVTPRKSLICLRTSIP